MPVATPYAETCAHRQADFAARPVSARGCGSSKTECHFGGLKPERRGIRREPVCSDQDDARAHRVSCGDDAGTGAAFHLLTVAEAQIKFKNGLHEGVWHPF